MQTPDDNTATDETTEPEPLPAASTDDDPDDGTEGHGIYARNVGVSFDGAEPAEPEPAEPVSATSTDDDPDDGAEGHGIYARNVGVSFDD